MRFGKDRFGPTMSFVKNFGLDRFNQCGETIQNEAGIRIPYAISRSRSIACSLAAISLHCDRLTRELYAGLSEVPRGGWIVSRRSHPYDAFQGKAGIQAHTH